MVRIVEDHGLVAVPADLDVERLSVRPGALERALTPRTRAVLVAHLFGSRMPVEAIAEFARAHGLVLVEDCAQCFDGGGYRGSDQSDVSMCSFGPIKTATALGGGVLRFRDRELRDRTAAVQSGWPLQSRRSFATRACKYAALKLLSARPPYTAFAALCRLAGTNHDRAITRSVRGFAGAGFFDRIRRRPSAPLLALLGRRVSSYRGSTVARRTAAAESGIALLKGIERPGATAEHHSHWVFPILCAEPEKLMRHLWRRGFDATLGKYSLCVVDPPEGLPDAEPARARETYERLLYLPVHEATSPRDHRRLAAAIAEFKG
jgi:dTDP-4-amino-4,6-dideoxygalactose transaminase